MNRTLQVAGRKIWDSSPGSFQLLLRPMFQHFKLKRAKSKIHDSALLQMRSKKFTREIDDYWMEYYGKRIVPLWHHIYANYTGVEDVRFIPQDVWASEMHDVFNDPLFRDTTYGDKNLYDNLFSTAHSPKTCFKKARGKYFDALNNEINSPEAFDLLRADDYDKIIKPSLGGGGARVFKIVIDKEMPEINGVPITIRDIESKMMGAPQLADNYIVQYKVVQHQCLAAPHPASLNTIRVVTFRWKQTLTVLYAVIRFGNKDNIIDNSSDALWCAVNSKGLIDKKAADKKLNVYSIHPYTNYSFQEGYKVPNWEKIVDLCIIQHKNLLHMEFAAWDIAVTEAGYPCFIEVNSTPPVSMHQIVCRKPLFGDFTADVLQYIKNSRKTG